MIMSLAALLNIGIISQTIQVEISYDYTQAIRLEPSYATTDRNRIISYQKLHLYDLALQDAKELIKSLPNDRQSYSFQADIYKHQQKFD